MNKSIKGTCDVSAAKARRLAGRFMKTKNIYKIYEWDEYNGWMLYNTLTNKRAAIQEFNWLNCQIPVKLIYEKVYSEVLRESPVT